MTTKISYVGTRQSKCKNLLDPIKKFIHDHCPPEQRNSASLRNMFVNLETYICDLNMKLDDTNKKSAKCKPLKSIK